MARMRTGKRRGGRGPSGGGGGGISGLRWSQPSTWPGGVFPDENTTVTIPAGTTYIIDTPSALAADVQLYGTLIGDPSVAAKLTTGWIDVRATGLLELGSAPSSRYTGALDFEINGEEADSPSTNRYGHDQTGSTVAGNGRLSLLHVSLDVNVPAAAETITFTVGAGGTTGTVSGSVSGALGNWTLNNLFNNKIRFVPVGTFVPGETITIAIWQQGRKNNGVSRAINIHAGGVVRMNGSRIPTSNVPLGANAAQNANTFTLASAPSDWRANDQIVITGSQYRDVASGQSQLFTLASNAAGASIATTSNLSASRWGVMQYVTDAGISLSPGTLPAKPSAMLQADYDAISKTIDERARVANLTRGIRIYAPNDAAWTGNGFGVHIMRHPGGLLELDGVEVFRADQRGNFGRYPIHLHGGSYQQPDGMNLPSNGVLIGNISDRIENCSVHDSSQRAIVYHMTKGGTIRNNVCYNIAGHAVFGEDGSETETVIHDNIVIKVTNVAPADALVMSDSTAPASGDAAGASCFWLANPSVSFEGNQAFESQFCGIWNAIAQLTPLGLSREIAMVPTNMPITSHKNNRASGVGSVFNGFNNSAAMITGFSHETNRGRVSDGGTRYMGPNGLRQTIEGAQLSFANRLYFNRIGTLRYLGWTSSSTETWCFVGAASNAGLPGLIDRCLGAGWTLNNSTLRNTYPRWMTSYHELLNAKNAIVVNFPYAPTVHLPTSANVPQFGAAIGGGDLYTNSMFNFYEFQHIIPVNSLVLFRPRPPHLGDGQPLNNRHWTYAGAVQDKNGIAIPAGRFRVYDVPFLTAGLGDAVALTPAGVGEVHTATRYFGVIPTNSNAEAEPYSPRQPMTVDRLDPGNLSNVLGSWVVGNGNLSPGVVFRSFSAQQNGVYRLTWQDDTVTYAMLSIEFLTQSTDKFVIAVEKSGGAPTAVFITTRDDNINAAGQQAPLPSAGHLSGGEARNYASVGSIAAVLASAGEEYFYDGGTGLLWACVRGGLNRVGSYPNGLQSQEAKPCYLCIKSN